MPDLFISYSSQDERFAQFLHRHLLAEHLTVFMASVSLKAGERWSQAILQNLRSSQWVFFLASRAACRAPYVQQEMGAAVICQKRLIPVVWDMPPSELPGWTKEFQALNLAGASLEEVQAQLSAIAGQIKSEKFWGGVVGLLLVGGLMFAAKGK
jgi:hypothetical protein